MVPSPIWHLKTGPDGIAAPSHTTEMSAYNKYTPAQQELRDIAFANSSASIVGAKFVDGWTQLTPRPATFSDAGHGVYLPTNTIASLAAARYENNPDAGWVTVPSERVMKRRERAAQRRKMREADASAWLGRSDLAAEAPVAAAGSALVNPRSFQSDWVLRKDGSHDLVSY